MLVDDEDDASSEEADNIIHTYICVGRTCANKCTSKPENLHATLEYCLTGARTVASPMTESTAPRVSYALEAGCQVSRTPGAY